MEAKGSNDIDDSSQHRRRKLGDLEKRRMSRRTEEAKKKLDVEEPNRPNPVDFNEDDSDDEVFKSRKRKSRTKVTLKQRAGENEGRNVVQQNSPVKKTESKSINDDSMTIKPQKKVKKDSVNDESTSIKPQKNAKKDSKTVSRNSNKGKKSSEDVSSSLPGTSHLDTLNFPQKPSIDLFCPICQIPLEILKISAAMHTASCNIQDDLPDCPDGKDCVNVNMFHYRDFSHQELAAYRISDHYVAPNIVFTPKKTKERSPSKRPSTSKKRPSKSPVASTTKKVPRRDNTLKKERSISPALFSEDCDEPDPVIDLKKRLSFSEDPVTSHLEVHMKTEENSHASTSEDNDFLNMINCEVDIKDELESQGTEADVRSFTPRIETNDEAYVQSELQPEKENKQSELFKCDMTLQYDATVSTLEQRINKYITECSETCLNTSESLGHDDDDDTLNATCSLAIKSKGAKRSDAAVKSPVAINLMFNNSGWEALEIVGKPTAVVHELSMSLCKCYKKMNVACSVNDPNIAASNVKMEPDCSGLEEKFSATLEGLGLKSPASCVQPLHHNVEQAIADMKQKTHQVSITSFFKQNQQDVASSSGLIPVPSNVVKQERSESPGSCSSFSLESTGSLAFDSRNSTPGNDDPFLSEVTSGASSRSSTPSLASSRSSTPLHLLQSRLRSSVSKYLPSLPNGKASRPTTPTPVPMVAERSSPSSWTLRPTSFNHYGQSEGNGTKKVPPYKRIPDTPFVVDAFQYGAIPGVKVYFLSHFHADHYTRLRKGFKQPIFCSKVTANLVLLKLRIDEEFLHILHIGEPRVICGVEVEVFDANHCPGSVMFLFRLSDGRTFLHVGDFRAHPCMEEYPQLRRIDKLYLDTTYCDPAYDFPPQEEIVAKVIETVRSHLQQNRLTLFVCGTYTVGKEKVFIGLAEAFNWRIWARSEKQRVLHCLENKDLDKRMTKDPLQAQVHVMSMSDVAAEKLQEHLKAYSCKYSHIVGFKPTGWTTSTSLKSKPSDFQKTTRGKVTIYGVPYSEHSSFSELRRFVRFIRPGDIQVTVNVGKHAQYKKLFQQWLSSSGDSDSQVSMRQFLVQSS